VRGNTFQQRSDFFDGPEGPANFPATCVLCCGDNQSAVQGRVDSFRRDFGHQTNVQGSQSLSLEALSLSGINGIPTRWVFILDKNSENDPPETGLGHRDM